MDAEHGLTEQHLTDINAGLADANKALRLVALAKQAEVDTGTAEADALSARDRLLKIKQVYFPGR